MAEFLKVGETTLYLIFVFLKKKRLLTELLNYPNDAVSLNLTTLFLKRERERRHSNTAKI